MIKKSMVVGNAYMHKKAQKDNKHDYMTVQNKTVSSTEYSNSNSKQKLKVKAQKQNHKCS